MRSKRPAPVGPLALLALLAACVAPDPLPDASGGDSGLAALAPPALEAAARIDGETVAGHVRALADDALEGRGPGTEGDRAARRLIAEELERLGLSPAGPGGGWEQTIPILGVEASMPERWSFRAEESEVSFRWWDEYIAASGLQQEEVAVSEAEVVFVGYGIEAPEEDWDDFKGADLRGKVLLILNNDPHWDPGLFAGERRLYYGRWTYKYEEAARRGAAGAIVIHTEPSAGYRWQVVQTSWTGPQFELPAGDEPRLRFAAWLARGAAERLVALSGRRLRDLEEAARSRDFRPVPLGVSTSLRFTNTLTRTETANVLGVLPGRDPELKAEAVVYTAHHDHLGVGRPDQDGDRIYNGALDNASGVAQILAVARAFAALPEPPRRSILILAVAAEEQGLLGSRFFARHPTIPPGRLAANLNIDGGNIWGRTRDVAVIGRGKSSLEDLLEAAADTQGRIVTDEPYPDKGYYYRSDQLNFARIGVPALYFKSGTDYVGRPDDWGRASIDAWRNSRYHQPSDEMDETWNLEGMVEDARLAFLVGLMAAEADAPPRWREGDEFEEARRIALRALASP